MELQKTVDSDLPITDHCTGYGSVVRWLAVSEASRGGEIRLHGDTREGTRRQICVQNGVTQAFLDYVTPIIGGPLPDYARLEKHFVKKLL